MLDLNHDCSQISIESESQNVMSYKSEFHVLCILFQAKAKQKTQTLDQDHTKLLCYLLLCSYSYISGPFSMRWALVPTAQDSQPDKIWKKYC